MTTVADIGEDALLRRVDQLIQFKALKKRPEIEIITGIGDDAASWRVLGIEVSSTDCIVEGVHFRRSTFTDFAIGWKSWVTNISDIIAMGATPLGGLVTLGVPRDMLLDEFDALYEGILTACEEYQTIVFGGDIVSSPILFVSVSMIGSCDTSPLLRSTAQIGDLIAVSGPLGGARGGLMLLEQGFAINNDTKKDLVKKQLYPIVKEGCIQLLKDPGIHAVMDLSDGLVPDLAKLTLASGVAAEISSSLVPVSQSLLIEFPDDYMEMGLLGGEDYELLMTGTKDAISNFVSICPESAVVGRVLDGTAGEVEIRDNKGKKMQLRQLKWEHFHEI